MNPDWGLVPRVPAPPNGFESFAAPVAPNWKMPLGAVEFFCGVCDVLKADVVELTDDVCDWPNTNGVVLVFAGWPKLKDGVLPPNCEGATVEEVTTVDVGTDEDETGWKVAAGVAPKPPNEFVIPLACWPAAKPPNDGALEVEVTAADELNVNPPERAEELVTFNPTVVSGFEEEIEKIGANPAGFVSTDVGAPFRAALTPNVALPVPSLTPFRGDFC